MGTGIVNPNQICIQCKAGATRNARTFFCAGCASDRAKARGLAVNAAISAARPIRTCLDCDIVVRGPMLCCAKHSAERALMRGRRSSANWRRRYPDKVLAQRIRYPRHPKIFRPALMAYPFIRVARDEHAELIEVNGLVPQQIAARSDVVQEIMLALYECRTTIDAVRAGGWRPFVRGFYRNNHEAGGQALSLDTPMRDGRSWHDVLRAGDQL